MSPKPKSAPAKPNSTPAPSPDDEETDQYEPEDELEDGAEEEPVRNKAKKRLSSEAAAHRVRANAAEAKVATLEARIAQLEHSAGTEELVAENQELRVANAFLEEAAGMFSDLGAAYKLLDRELVTVSDGGEVTGMKDAVQTVANRYAFLWRNKLNPPKRSRTRQPAHQALHSMAKGGTTRGWTCRLSPRNSPASEDA